MSESQDTNFEKELWESACILRGNMDASEYKQVILGLIFLKYISDKFDLKYKYLIEEGEGYENDEEEYIADGIFFVPESARWDVIAKDAHNATIGKTIDIIMQIIEDKNKILKGVLPKNFAREELDKRKLGEVVDLFTNKVKMVNSAQNEDVLGRAYEYCLSKFAEQEGKLAGEFYTPSCIVKTIVEVLQPFEGRVYDPCCGSGGMFVQSTKFINNHSGNRNDISVYGQDSNPSTWKLCMMNLAIRGIEANLGNYNADTFFDDCHKNKKFDFIMANPPFNLSDWGAEQLKNDIRWKYGIPPNGNANFAWIQHMIHHLSEKGKIGLVLANGSLSSQAGGEGEIRKQIVEDDLIEGIIAMPTNLFFTTGIPVCLWFISKNKKQKRKTLFIDARNLGTMISRKLRELTDEDISKIVETFEAFKQGKLSDVKGFCAVADTEQIANNDYILTPGRYVGVEEQEEDAEDFDEKMNRLTAELSTMFDEGKKLEEEIKKNLGAIGFGW